MGSQVKTGQVVLAADLSAPEKQEQAWTSAQAQARESTEPEAEAPAFPAALAVTKCRVAEHQAHEAAGEQWFPARELGRKSRSAAGAAVSEPEHPARKSLGLEE